MKSRSLKEVALVTVPSENTGSDRCHVLARILNSDVRTLNMGNNVGLTWFSCMQKSLWGTCGESCVKALSEKISV